MKKVILSIFSMIMLASASPLCAANVGVPSECEYVMLQAFYWNSYGVNNQATPKYGRTKWMDLQKDTTAIAANFDLVWFPPSAYGQDGNGKGGVGYIPKKFTDQTSDWGRQVTLEALIASLHRHGVKVIADIVINHHGGSDWCTFYPDNFGQYGSFQLTQKHICYYDDGFTNPASPCYNAPASDRGATDSGDDFDGARDLDHKNEYIQNWSKAYLKWMLNKMNYDGFRYDMTKGFSGQYLKMYNEAAQPSFSVSEFWDNITPTVNHIIATDYNTLVFDFPLKWQIKDAFLSSTSVYATYSKLMNPSNSLRNRGYRRYAVSFIDNHDTFERGDNDGEKGREFLGYNVSLDNTIVKNKILQANAYILMTPGVPCIFWPHWYKYREQINAIIALRKLAGIHSESDIYETAGNQYYEAIVTGHRGQLILRLGTNRSPQIPDGFYVALEGGSDGDYTIYAAYGTGVEQVQTSAANDQKFMKDGKLYIRHGDQIYDAQGRKIY